MVILENLRSRVIPGKKNVLAFPHVERSADPVTREVHDAKLSAHRLGRFTIGGELVRENWALLLSVFCHVVVIDAGYDRVADRFQYLGYSLQFDENVGGDAVPEYKVIARKFRGQISATFNRIS